MAAVLAGLDFDDDYRDMKGNGLVAVGRFTGRGITEQDLAMIESAGVAFRIVPDLPELSPYDEASEAMRRMPGQAPLLGPAVLRRLPEPRLRDVAWWCAAEAARYAGVAEDPDITASIAARALTPEAHARARRAQLQGGEHPLDVAGAVPCHQSGPTCRGDRGAGRRPLRHRPARHRTGGQRPTSGQLTPTR